MGRREIEIVKEEEGGDLEAEEVEGATAETTTEI